MRPRRDPPLGSCEAGLSGPAGLVRDGLVKDQPGCGMGRPRLAAGRRVRDRAVASCVVNDTQHAMHHTHAPVALLDRLGVPTRASVVHVGTAPTAVPALLARGHDDVTVVDASESALAAARRQVGSAAPVRWVAVDALAALPGRRHDVWLDAFRLGGLDESGHQRYRDVLRAGTVPAGLVLARVSDVGVATSVLGDGFGVVDSEGDEHDPVGPFTWVALRRV